MKITITIEASTSSMLRPVVRSILASKTADEWRQMIQERTPAGVRVDKVTITQEYPHEQTNGRTQTPTGRDRYDPENL